VLGRSTVARHRDKPDATAWRQDLGADYVVAGDVLRENDRLRVLARLLDAARGEVLWAEAFDRDLATTEIFQVQDEIAARVVATIAQPRGALAAPELARLRRPPAHLGSYECLVLFYDYSANRSPARHQQLRTSVAESLRTESRVASLWAVSSFLATDTARFGYNADGHRDAAIEAALKAARRAVRLDPQDALGYHALFLAHFNRGDMRAFRRAADRAVALNPNNSEILADYGVHLTMGDEWDLGLLLLRGALTLNPEPPDWYWFPFFSWHFHRQEFDAALDFALRAQSEGFFWTHAMHALAYEALGRHEPARAAIRRLLEIYPDFAECAEQELARWVSTERMEQVVEMLRRAGLPAPART
jgi:Flp pilus assembly protein TadD